MSPCTPPKMGGIPDKGRVERAMIDERRFKIEQPEATEKAEIKSPSALRQRQTAPLVPYDTASVMQAESILRSEQAEALLTISALLNSDLNSGRVLFNLLRYICALFQADRAAVFLRQNLQAELTRSSQSETDTDGDSQPARFQGDIGPVICAASTGLTPDYISSITNFYENEEFRRLQAARQPVYIADAQTDTRLNGLRDLNKREGFKTMLTLPLLHRDSLIGLLVLYHNQRRVYSQEELKLLTVFANQATLSIINARLYEAALRREKEASLLSEAGRIFNSSLQLRDVLTNVGQLAGSIAGNVALIYVIKEGTDLAYPVSFYPPSPDSPVKEGKAIKLGQGLVGKTMQSGIPNLITGQPDLRTAPFIKPNLKINGLICVPLKVRGRIIGALVCYQPNPKDAEHRPLDKSYMAIVQALADRAAAAIENARLYEAERRDQRAKDEFLSFISHELRTPLTSLKGFSTILNKRLGEAEYTDDHNFRLFIESLKHHTKVMDGQVDRLQILIEDLTSISNIETGQLQLKRRSTEIVSIIHRKVAELERQTRTVRLPRMSHHFDVKATPSQIMAEIDATAFERVLHNLLSNAIKFSPRGGNIRIRVQESLNDVVLSIQDEGIGISPDEQARIFQRFYKASAAPGRANGLGLGLYISKGLVEAMGGHIEVESDEGRGATFTVYLKRHIPPML